MTPQLQPALAPVKQPSTRRACYFFDFAAGKRHLSGEM